LAITKEKKNELVADYSERLAQSQAVIFTDHRGLTVKAQEALRRQLWESESSFQVVKNTLLSRALQNAGMSVPEEVLTGPTALGYCYEDAAAVVKILTQFAKETDVLTFKGGILRGQYIGPSQVLALGALPPREVLLAQVLGSIQAPITGVVNVLAGTLRGLVNVLQARADQLEGATN